MFKLLVAAAAICSVGVAMAPGQAMAQTKPGMAAAAPATLLLKVCNRSGRNASVAVSYMEVGDTSGMFTNRGWYNVDNGQCQDLVTTDNSNFYFYADALDGSGRTWRGDHNLCVQYPGPYTLRQNGGTCPSGQELRGFNTFHADQPGSWTWTLDP